MNPLQVTNLCSTRRHVASAAVAKAIQIEAGDHRQLPPDHVALSTRCCSAAFHGGSQQSAGLSSSSFPFSSLLQQMPVAQMPDIKGKSSAQDSTTRLRDSSEIEASVEALWHHVASTKYPIYIYSIYHNIVCHAICMFNGEKIESNCHLFAA